MKDNPLETFTQNCQYLGLKRLAMDYQLFIDKATKENMGFFDFIAHVTASEVEARKERSISYRICESKLPQPYKLLGDFDFSFQPKLKKSLIMDLASMNFIGRKESILFIGDCGTGKSHLARSL